jgi:hypothetical protein
MPLQNTQPTKLLTEAAKNTFRTQCRSPPVQPFVRPHANSRPCWKTSAVILLHASPRVSNGRLETLVHSLIASAYRKEKKRWNLDSHVNVSMFSLYWSWLSKIHYEVDYYPFRGWAMWLAQ